MNKPVDLQKEHERATAKLNQLKGRRDALLARLKSEFGYDTIEQAEDALAAMGKEHAELSAAHQIAYDEFIATFGDRIGS